MDYELAAAVGELSEAENFIVEVARLSAKEMFEAIRARDPAFIEHCEAMEKPPESALDLWEGFSIWTVRRLISKYQHIWNQVVDAYFESPGQKRKMQELEMWSDIDEIIKESNLE